MGTYKKNIIYAYVIFTIIMSMSMILTEYDDPYLVAGIFISSIVYSIPNTIFLLFLTVTEITPYCIKSKKQVIIESVLFSLILALLIDKLKVSPGTAVISVWSILFLIYMSIFIIKNYGNNKKKAETEARKEIK